MVETFNHCPKFEGSNPSPIVSRREKKAKKSYQQFTAVTYECTTRLLLSRKQQLCVVATDRNGKRFITLAPGAAMNSQTLIRKFYTLLTRLPAVTSTTFNLSGDTKGGSIAVPMTSCLTGLESAVCQLTIFVFICKTD